MPRRHSRMFLRGKPGVFMLVSFVCIGVFLAYYTLGSSSSVKPSKYRVYKNMRGSGKIPNYQIPIVKKVNGNTKFQKNLNINQMPKPVLETNFGAQRNFGGLRKNEVQNPGSEEHHEDGDYTFPEKDNKPAVDKNKPVIRKQRLYVEPDKDLSNYFSNMKRIVHLDLKGAPPKLTYLKKILPLLGKLGATGLLIEYEDMFPYTDKLSVLSAENAYSAKDISQLLAVCKQNNLDVIPLIQTFGHMEFVLKHTQYQHLREKSGTLQVISPMHNESYVLIDSMIQQMLSAHPDAKYLHIGCDEVYEFGTGKSAGMITRGKTKEELKMQHIVKVAQLVKSVRPIDVIVWDDELRWIQEKLIMTSGLNKFVEPMVWNYTPDPRVPLPNDIWTKYGKLFSNIWAASAFKGATGSAQFYTNVSHHLENHLSWVEIIKDVKDQIPKIKFRGVALTGWQRYDHFATLCELLPEALPSLAVCLATIKNGGFNSAIHIAAGNLLTCSDLIELQMPRVDEKNKVMVSQDCFFPGRDVYYSTQQLWGIVNGYTKNDWLQSTLNGWLTDYRIQRGDGNPGRMKSIVDKVSKATTSLTVMIDTITKTLNPIFNNNTITEWVEVNLRQRIRRLNDMAQKAKTVLTKMAGTERPLHDTVPAGNENKLPVDNNRLPEAGNGGKMRAGKKGTLPETGNLGSRGYNRMARPKEDNQAELPSSGRYRTTGNPDVLKKGVAMVPGGDQGTFMGGNRRYSMTGNERMLKGGEAVAPGGGNKGTYLGNDARYRESGNKRVVDGAGRFGDKLQNRNQERENFDRAIKLKIDEKSQKQAIGIERNPIAETGRRAYGKNDRDMSRNSDATGGGKDFYMDTGKVGNEPTLRRKDRTRK